MKAVQTIYNKLLSLVGLVVALVLIILGVIIFSYILIFAAVVGVILFTVVYIRAKMLQLKYKKHQKQTQHQKPSQNQGRVIEHDETKD